MKIFINRWGVTTFFNKIGLFRRVMENRIISEQKIYNKDQKYMIRYIYNGETLKYTMKRENMTHKLKIVSQTRIFLKYPQVKQYMSPEVVLEGGVLSIFSKNPLLKGGVLKGVSLVIIRH